MSEGKNGGRLVLRIWGSFLAALLSLALIQAVLTHSGFVFLEAGLAFGYAFPLLVVASVCALVYEARIERRPLVWSAAATAGATIAVALLLPYAWTLALAVSILASAIFLIWMKLRPLATS
jgi:hypothetical protein